MMDLTLPALLNLDGHRLTFSLPDGGQGQSTVLISPGARDPEKPLVICLHGFPDNALSFRHQIGPLERAGYGVACLTLPGYEPGSRLPGTGRGCYALTRVADTLNTMIRTLIQDLDRPADQPIHLIGHDWGALSAYLLATRHPSLLASLTTLTIPYPLSLTLMLARAPHYLRYAWYIQFFWTPWLPERRLPRHNWRFIERLWRDWSPGWSLPLNVGESIKATLAEPGVLEAALGYYRAIAAVSPEAFESRQQMMNAIPIPTLQIQGSRDGCIPAGLWRLNDERLFLAGVTHRKLEAGHFPHQEQPDAFHEHLLPFLERHAKASSVAQSKTRVVS